MDGLEGAVLDVEQVETPVGGEGSGASDNAHEGAGGQQQTEYDPFESKSARELSAWLKAKRDSGDPLDAKAAKALKDIFGQSYAFKKEFPEGLDSARSVKALVDSVIHQGPDGQELKGAEAIAALQDSVREYAQIDEQLAQGDPAVLDTLGEEFNGGLAKLAPLILDRVAQSDPEAYAAAVLPHFVRALAGSELVSSFNGLVDVLNEAPPAWLTPDQKTAWGRDQMQKVIALAGGMGKWLNAQADKAKALPQGNGNGARSVAKKDSVSEERASFEKERQDHHWNTNISPRLDQHADAQFRALFAPYAKRLNLDVPTTTALKMEFARRVASTAAKDAAYIGQIGRYRAMKNPDPATVLNYAKVHFDKHAKTVLESLVNERYKPFLNQKPRGGQPGNQNGAGNGAAPAKGIQIVAVKPSPGTYDPRKGTLEDLHNKIYYLNNGKVVQVRST